MEVRDQVVRNNRAWGNSDHGIMLRTIQDAVVENNIVAGNARGFFIYDAEYNTLRGNLVVDNQVGVHLWAGSTRNVVEGTTSSPTASRCAMWAPRRALGQAGEGNHWSNYLGWDRNGDGGRRALRGQRPGRPPLLAPPDGQAAAGQPGGAGAAPGRPAVSAAARPQRRRPAPRMRPNTRLE
jgi:parallel beta-helix repeat protein